MKIESLQNKQVKEWVRLHDKKYRDKAGLFLIEGDHLLKEALAKNMVEIVIATSDEYEIPGIPFYLVSAAIMKKISLQVSSTPVIAIVKMFKEEEIEGNVLILDNIQDPGNMGTMLRSAVAFNIKTIIVSKDTVDLYNDKVLRASEGMVFHINVIRRDLEKIIPCLKQSGYKVYGTNVVKGKELENASFLSKNAVVIGNEGKGVREEILRMCDDDIYIPINKKCESLNAGVAASIIMYQMGVKERGI